jgi:hypothetical protein
LKYQLAVSCGTGEILDIDGPFKGAAADITIAKITIVPQMSLGEKVWTDAAYGKRTPSKNFVLEPPFTPFLAPTRGKNISKEQRQTNKRIYRVRQIVERSILRLKQYAHITQSWPYSFKLHYLCIHAQAKLVNFDLQYHPLNKKNI